MTSFLVALDRALQRLVGLLLRTALALFFGLVVLGVVFLAVGVALLSVLWSLLRGRRPAVFTVYQRVRQAAQPFGRAAGRGSRPVDTAADVVDVQAHEVRPGPQHRLPGQD